MWWPSRSRSAFAWPATSLTTPSRSPSPEWGSRCTRGRGSTTHAFVREGRYVRTATVTYDGTTTWVVSGIKDLVILKSTDSEFWGYIEDRYTTLQPTRDRIMATSSRPSGCTTAPTWTGKSYDTTLQAMLDAFAGHHSLALQHTLYQMGAAVINGQPDRRNPLLRAEQTSLHLRSRPVRHREQQRSVPRRRPPVRADRGDSPPRRRRRSRPGLRSWPGLVNER